VIGHKSPRIASCFRLWEQIPQPIDEVVSVGVIVENRPPLKDPAAGQRVSYAQINLKLQPRRKKLILTTKPALVIGVIIFCVNG